MGEVMRAIPAQNENNKLTDTPPSDSVLLHAVDRVPETRGMGVEIIVHGIPRCIRKAKPGDSVIIFEYRRSPLVKPQIAGTKPRNRSISPAREWISMGLNCGGAALAWIGFIGTAAAEPVTGGLDTPATVALWAGSLSTSAQCIVSVGRVTAHETGHDAALRKLDGNTYYNLVMDSFDVVGLVSAKGAIEDIVKTRKALKASGVEWDSAVTAEINRQQRLRITNMLGLQGSKRVAAQSISRVVKQRILATVAAALGMATSSAVGATHDLIVWIMTPKPSK